VIDHLAWFEPETVRFLYRAFRGRFRDQRKVLLIIKEHLQIGGVVCDIGANKGIFAFWLARWCKASAVVAFEPQPELANYLTTICRKLGFDNVTIEAKAVYSRSGTGELFVPRGRLQGASMTRKFPEGNIYEAIRVPLVSLDEYFNAGEHVTLMKVDVEGVELEVFKGAERILREQSPVLVFECEDRHLESGTITDVFSYLESFGYRGAFLLGNRRVPISEFDPTIHQRRDGHRYWKRKGYCNNFIFYKPGNPHPPSDNA
jgi:FkbM family methyltransferase